MENASKALLMAATVLIGIMILSLAVYLFATFGLSSAELHSQIQADRLNEFNTMFTSYEGKEDITIHDVVTVANMAKDNNDYYELTRYNSGKDYYIQVKLGNTSIEAVSEENKYKMLSDEKYKDKYATCKVSISGITKRVYLVKFEF